LPKIRIEEIRLFMSEGIESRFCPLEIQKYSPRKFESWIVLSVCSWK